MKKILILLLIITPALTSADYLFDVSGTINDRCFSDNDDSNNQIQCQQFLDQLLIDNPDVTGATCQQVSECKASNQGVPTLDNPIESDTFDQLLDKLLTAFIYLAVVVAFIALVFVGFQFVAAQGNQEQLKKAKRNAKWVVIGVIIVFSARIIVDVIRATLNALQ